MKITDLNGCPIVITNLDQAIQLAEEYKEYKHTDSSFSEFDKRQKAYWQDIYEKLKAIKEKSNNH